MTKEGLTSRGPLQKAGELDKTEEVLSDLLPADEDATLPLYPGEEPLDEPASHVTA